MLLILVTIEYTLRIVADGELDFESATIICTVNFGDHCIVVDGATVVLKGGTMLKTTYSGKGIKIKSNSIVTITDFRFTGFKNPVIYSHGEANSVINLNDVEITDQDGQYSPIVIYQSPTVNLNVQNCRFTNNSNSNSGGGLSFHGGGTLTVNNSIISNNMATWGGGLYLRDSASVMIENSFIEDNEATQIAGGISFENVTSGSYIKSTAINGNKAGSTSGGILYDGNELEIKPTVEMKGNTGFDLKCRTNLGIIFPSGINTSGCS